MQKYFSFLKLTPLGQNKDKPTGWHKTKIIYLKIGFDI